LASDILKNKQYYLSKELEIQQCIVEIIKNNLCEFDVIKKLVDESLIKDNKKLKNEKSYLQDMYNDLKNKVDSLNY